MNFHLPSYSYLTWNFGYWKKQGVKCDSPWPVVGTMNNPFVEPFDIQDMRMYKKHGRVYGIFEGRNPCLHVGDPEMLKNILVKDFNAFRNRRVFPVAERDGIIKKFLSIMKDDDWKELRSIVTPTFTTGKIKQMIYLMNECAKDMVKQMEQYADNKIPIESKQYISSFSMNVIATCAFGMKFDFLDNPKNEFVKHARSFFSNPPKSAFLSLLFPSLVEFLPSFFPRESVKFFEKLLNNAINTRKQEAAPRKDFLQLLLEARNECERRIKNVENAETNEMEKNGSKFVMTHEHVLAQAMIFLIAGFETTGITLTFTLYNLIQQEEIQERLIQEIDEVLKKHNNVINYESIGEMEYLDMVISETLRMYPPVVRIERTCEEENYKLKDIRLTKDMVIGIPVYSMHYDEEFFPAPTVFNPERFSPENRASINPYTYMPFGYGPRNCIGMRFAQIEMKIALISILRNFRARKCSETQIPFKRLTNSGFLQPESLKIKLEKRIDAV